MPSLALRMAWFMPRTWLVIEVAMARPAASSFALLMRLPVDRRSMAVPRALLALLDALAALPATALSAGAEVVALTRVQAEALLALPTSLAALNAAAVRITATLEGTDDALVVLKGVGVRADALISDLEGPLRDLVPGLRRIAPVLAHQTFDQVPATLVQIQDDLLPQVYAHLVPLFGALGTTQDQVASISEAVDRLMGLIGDVEARLGSLPLLRLRAGRKDTGA